MSKCKDRIMRADPKFIEELRDIKLERIKTGRDKKMKSDRRITAGIRRHNLWPIIKRDAIDAKLEEFDYE